jgi:hypothetical protein
MEGIQHQLLIGITKKRHNLQVEPAQKDLPWPVRITARTLGSFATPLKISVICSVSSMFITFAGGLCKAMVATGPFLL